MFIIIRLPTHRCDSVLHAPQLPDWDSPALSLDTVWPRVNWNSGKREKKLIHLLRIFYKYSFEGLPSHNRKFRRDFKVIGLNFKESFLNDLNVKF